MAVRPGTAQTGVRAGGESCSLNFQIIPVDVASVRILPQLQALGVEEKVRLQAAVADRPGAALPGAVISWRSGNLQVAVVAIDGVLRGVGVGRARIVASSGKGSAALELRITVANVTSVRIGPAAVLRRSGDTLVLRAEVHGNDFRPAPPGWRVRIFARNHV